MIGREKGAVQRLKEHHPDLLSYHFIIHQSVLCANLGKEYSDVMETIMKLVNYLRASSALQHSLLRAFLTELKWRACLLNWFCVAEIAPAPTLRGTGYVSTAEEAEGAIWAKGKEKKRRVFL
ncbi:hypothetical protein KUCAC02_008349 [Chaenocephalus aceratus]|uniref:Uncharacterized protein n=1 Tax=Chaenocephalus aceratus TaxID=36190 RepID=A0ACB9XA18_CHAAC|nr:hypothetical protein KUCAC02_008349 [Chaenocephalus aceratus]